MASWEKTQVMHKIYWSCCLSLLLVELVHTCCVPGLWYGPVRVLMTTVAQGMPGTDVQVILQGYDAEHHRVAVRYQENGTYIRDILDYGKGLELFITDDVWNSPHIKCSKHQLKGIWKPACTPANATRSAEFYMGHAPQEYYKTLYARAFTFARETLKVKTMMTTDKCSIVGEVVYDVSDPFGAKVINRLYVNQTFYPYDDFFKPPQNVTCVPDSNPPPLSPWRRLSLFGLLFDLPQY